MARLLEFSMIPEGYLNGATDGKCDRIPGIKCIPGHMMDCRVCPTYTETKEES